MISEPKRERDRGRTSEDFKIETPGDESNNSGKDRAVFTKLEAELSGIQNFITKVDRMEVDEVTKSDD